MIESLRLDRFVTCGMCKGTGKTYCITCKKGNVTPPWLAGMSEGKCSACESGKEMKCPVCEGSGRV